MGHGCMVGNARVKLIHYTMKYVVDGEAIVLPREYIKPLTMTC